MLAHPRACGENVLTALFAYAEDGQSPRPWGKLAHEPLKAQIETAHPHGRGENVDQ